MRADHGHLDPRATPLQHAELVDLNCDGKHDLSFRPRPYAFQHQMSLARIRKGEHCTHTCSQLSTIDEASDLRQILARDVDQKERGFNAMALRKMLIRGGHRRNQLAASAEDLKRTLLCFAADQINDSVRIPNLFLKALGPVVNHGVCAEVAHEGYPRLRSRWFATRKEIPRTPCSAAFASEMLPTVVTTMPPRFVIDQERSSVSPPIKSSTTSTSRTTSSKRTAV